MAPYFLRNLVHKRERSADARPLLKVLGELTWIQWALFFSGWLAWTCDSLDFFSVSLSVTHLQTQFGKSTTDITTAITLTLLFRSVGAVIFGILSDRFGRKWPLIWNLILVAILELGAGFVQTFKQFLALRSLLNLPVEARGVASGFLQEGYAVGYLLAAVINLFLVPEVSVSWRALFWTASGVSVFAAFIRLLLPESEVFLRLKRWKRPGEMLKKHWLLCIYAVLLMTGFNFLSHGSQDLYPTYLTQSKGISSHDATVATIIGNCGAIAGGVFAGWLSQYIGRRLTILIHVLLIGAFIPLWILPSTFSALAAGAFCIQFGMQGAWGVIPIQLSEMSPPLSERLSLVSLIKSEIWSLLLQRKLNQDHHHRKRKVVNVPDYAKVQGILIGVVAAFVFIVTLIGPENHGSHFEKHKTAFEEGGGQDDAVMEDEITPEEGSGRESGSVLDEKQENEKV
ncbi:carboxylic acid transporter [Gymnopilus junonius]|uniref:Carboxylic acid transporter n=1 Tax=Gymnopilus junonius TaxID=109634 RepID=A0A9P5N7R1_GYMJU|nr:carboxylic acid transporter [Gymnopilus junonius]